jgi:hypothetical protein
MLEPYYHCHRLIQLLENAAHQPMKGVNNNNNILLVKVRIARVELSVTRRRQRQRY